MQSRHQKVKDEKHLHVCGIRTGVVEKDSWQLLVVVVQIIFRELYAEKY